MMKTLVYIRSLDRDDQNNDDDWIYELTSKSPNLRLSDPDSKVQNEICALPHETIMSDMHG